MKSLHLDEGCALRRKESFEYMTPERIYDIELYENHDGTFYTIGVPRDTEKFVVYGSRELPSAKQAMQSLIDKIKREGIDRLFGNPSPAPYQTELDDETETDELEDDLEEDE